MERFYLLDEWLILQVQVTKPIRLKTSHYNPNFPNPQNEFLSKYCMKRVTINCLCFSSTDCRRQRASLRRFSSSHRRRLETLRGEICRSRIKDVVLRETRRLGSGWRRIWSLLLFGWKTEKSSKEFLPLSQGTKTAEQHRRQWSESEGTRRSWKSARFYPTARFKE